MVERCNVVGKWLETASSTFRRMAVAVVIFANWWLRVIIGHNNRWNVVECGYRCPQDICLKSTRACLFGGDFQCLFEWRIWWMWRSRSWLDAPSSLALNFHFESHNLRWHLFSYPWWRLASNFQFIYLFTHSLIHLFTHSLIHSFIYLFICTSMKYFFHGIFNWEGACLVNRIERFIHELGHDESMNCISLLGMRMAILYVHTRRC